MRAEKLPASADPDFMTRYWNSGYKLLCEYRNRNAQLEGDVPVVEYFQKRIGNPEAFDKWAEMEIRTDGEDFIIYLPYRKVGREVRIRTSDNYVSTLHLQDREKYIRQQMWHWRYGVWDAQLWAQGIPLQLLSGSQYFNLFNLRFTDAEAKGTCAPIYRRKDAQLLDYFEILGGYSVPPGCDRDSASIAKARAIGYTTNIFAITFQYLLLYEFADTIHQVDNAEKVMKYSRTFYNVFDTSPHWIRELILDSKLTSDKDFFQQGGEKSYKKGGSGSTYRTAIFKPNKLLNSSGRSTNEFLILGAQPTNTEGSRTVFLANDEVCKYKYDLNDVLDASAKCLIGAGSGINIAGLHIRGGTSDSNSSGSKIMARNMDIWRSIHENPETYGTHSLFLGVQHYYGINAQGWADEETAIRQAEEKRKGLETLEDSKKLINEKIHAPIRRSDCFLTVDKKTLNTVKIASQIEKAKALQIQIQTGHFVEERGRPFHPRWIPFNSPEIAPMWQILRLPAQEAFPDKSGATPSTIYIMGIDPADNWLTSDEVKAVLEGRADKSSHSHQSAIILNTITCEVVARYYFRHENPYNDYMQMLWGALFYNCYINCEMNKPGFAQYVWGEAQPSPLIPENPEQARQRIPTSDKGLYANFLLPKPDFIHTRGSGLSTLVGTYTAPNLSKHIYANDFILPYTDESPNTEYGIHMGSDDPTELGGISQNYCIPLLTNLKDHTHITAEINRFGNEAYKLETTDDGMALTMALIGRRYVFANELRQVQLNYVHPNELLAQALDEYWG